MYFEFFYFFVCGKCGHGQLCGESDGGVLQTIQTYAEFKLCLHVFVELQNFFGTRVLPMYGVCSFVSAIFFSFFSVIEFLPPEA